MKTKTLFEKIIDREIPSDIVYEDELCLCFKDITPQAPIHLLIVPKKVIPSLDDLQNEDQALMGHIFIKIKEIAQKLDLKDGYRVVNNIKEYGGQSVYHLHFHILGGRQLNWPPG